MRILWLGWWALVNHAASWSLSSLSFHQKNSPAIIASELFQSVTSSLNEQCSIDRRKSPALWRLLYDDDDDDDEADLMNNQDKSSNDDKPRRILQKPPEIMAPAGGWPQLYAAVSNGADAIYVGLSAFSARARATNFDPLVDLPKAVEYCHGHNVKVYVALNTLVFDHEVNEVATLLQACYRAGVDAVIYQDASLPRLAARVAPHLVLHASTQQSITSVDGVQYAATTAAATRVVLGRELSVYEIAHVIQQQQQDPSQSQSQKTLSPEIEVFVHGALCVSYSGQCFSSEAWGGRSANRGQCAQACRLPYQMIVTDRTDSSVSATTSPVPRRPPTTLKQPILPSYVLSPQDLCGLDHVPDLLQAGVACFKIEGRLKDASYVAATTRAYRQAVDQAWEDYQRSLQDERQSISKTRHGLPISTPRKALPFATETVTRNELRQVFSRGQDESYTGLTSGFLNGTHHQVVVRGRSPRHRGVHMGRLIAGTSAAQGILVMEYDDDTKNRDENAISRLKLGDGLVIDRGLPELEELGGPIYGLQEEDEEDPDQRHVAKRRRIVKIQLGRAVIQKWQQYDAETQPDQASWAPIGAHVWKTHDAAVTKKLKRLSQAVTSSPSTKLGDNDENANGLLQRSSVVQVRVSAGVDQPLRIHLDLLNTTAIMNGDSQSNLVLVSGMGETECNMELAASKGLTKNQIEKAIGTLGNTEFTLAKTLKTVDDENGGDVVTDWGELDLEQLPLWCPMSQIKVARRRAIQDLQIKIKQSETQKETDNTEVTGQDVASSSLAATGTHRSVVDLPSVKDAHQHILEEWSRKVSLSDGNADCSKDTDSRISVLCRTLEQVDALCSMMEQDNQALANDDMEGRLLDGLVSEIMVDFLEVEGMKEAVDRIRSVSRTVAHDRSSPVRVVVASPRILKPYEGGIWKSMLALEADALLVRSTGLLHRLHALGGPGARVKLKMFHEPNEDNENAVKADEERWVTIPRLLGDFSLNAANALSAFEMLTYTPNKRNSTNVELGMDRITASYDLNANSVARMASLLGPFSHRLEVVMHCKIPIFHTEHCVFARFLTKGNSYVDCGHACTRHSLHLRDELTGLDNLVLADMGW